MSAIDKAIDREVNSVFRRAYWILLLLYFTVDYIHAPQILMIMFIAPPADAYQYNPHAGNSTQTIISEWNFTDAEKNWIPGLLQSIFFIGFMMGTVLFGQLSDKYGRWSVSWKVFTMLMVAAFSMGVTQNWKQMMVCRIFSGLGIGGLSVVNTILLQEMSAARMWVLNGVMGSISFSVMSIVILLFAYFLPSWRFLCVAATFPALSGYLFYLFIPESPRWLFSQRKFKEAEKVMGRISKWNGNNSVEYQLLDDRPDEFENHHQEMSLKESANEVKNSMIDLIKYPVLRYRTLILSFQWFTTSFVFYCITLGAGSFSPNFYLAFGMSALSQLPAVPICLYFMEKKWCGRSGTQCGLMVLTACSMFVMYLLPNTKDNEEFRLILMMIAKVGTSGCFCLIYVYTPELYPTVVRNVGLGSMSTCARFGSMSAPFLATYTVNSGSETPFLVYGILAGLAGVLALCLPETCGKRIVNTIDEAYEHEEQDEEKCPVDLNVPARSGPNFEE